MRVIAGKYKNRTLKAGEKFRPTTDRVRETLFNILQNEIEGSVFVDVFSGSGSVGIEALSRGAARAYFIESNARALRIIEANLTHCCGQDKWRILNLPAFKALEVLREIDPTADLFFFDPPYDFPSYSDLLQNAVSLYPEALFVLETSVRTSVPSPDRLLLQKSRKIGETSLHFYRAA